MSEDWFMWAYEQKDHLHNKKLIVKEIPHEKGWHDHCEVCWARFSRYNGFDDLRAGYYEEESKGWICPKCYNAFANLFGWSIDKLSLEEDG